VGFVTSGRATNKAKGSRQCSHSSPGRLNPAALIGSSSCSGGLRLNPFLSCFVSQPLALDALKGDVGAVRVIEAKLGAGVLAEVEFGQVAVEMLAVDVLVNANDAAF